jgi:type II secretory pathway pseudopilin PulG
MNHSRKIPTTAPPAQRIWNQSGFALVATLSLMILLAILAVGLLSLSAVTLRSSGQGAAQAEARANARMALMVALGELQKHTGTDTRVTAPADILNPGAPSLTGVWRSWEGDDHDATGRPRKPLYSDKSPGTSGSRFLTWLVSGIAPGADPSSFSPGELVSESPSQDTVPLIAAGTLADNPGQVHVRPETVNNGAGAFAWWVSSENQKARLVQPYQPRDNTINGWSEMANSHAAPDPEPFGLEAMLDDPEKHTPEPNDVKPLQKVATLDSTELLPGGNSAQPQRSFHDLSVSAVGLLTNTATGGWRKDLSIFSERWSNLPDSGLPLFRLNPTAGASAVTSVSKPTGTNPTASQSIFYPWSSYPALPAGLPGTAANPFPTRYMEQHGAVASWHSLVDYVTSYKVMDYNPSSRVGSVPLTWARTHRITPWGPSAGNFTNQDLFNYLHNNQKSPVLARIQWVFKVRSRRMNPADPNTQFHIDLLVTPIYTLWNPHNVAIRVDQHYGVSMNKTMPVAIAFAKGSEILDYNSPPAAVSGMFRRYTRGSLYDLEGNAQYDSSMPGNYTGDWETSNGQAAGFPISMSLAPGEARQFSLAANTAVSQTGIMGVLKDGYDGANAFGFARFSVNQTTGLVTWNASRSSFLRTDTLKFGMRFDNITRLGAASNKQGPGIYMSFGRWAGPDPGNPTSAGNNRYLGDGFANYTMLTNLDFSKAYWNEPPDLPSYPVLAIEANGSNPPWTPVFSIIWGPRFTIGTGAGKVGNRPTKGLLQNNPMANGVLTTSDKLPTNHPVNLAFDFSYHGHQPNSDTLPEEGVPGYIASGNQTGNGLSRLILGEIPLRPISSLMELQGWDLRARNPLPPFQYNIIGNSDANPMIPMDAVVLDPNTVPATNRQHDDAYCANHLLFDDWFLSSIAPEPANFGKVLNKTAEEVYRSFLKGDGNLVNRAYRPIPEDIAVTDTLANQRVAQMLSSSDGWLKVASRFEVEGMFNVNSTSVKAWRSLLGHARKQQIAHHTKNGVTLAADKEDHVVSRFSVAADIKAGAGVGMSGTFPNSSEYTGFRTLSDSQLDDLAGKIVEQVRKRGPFLSLSEFVNRRLDGNEELALSGAVQTALNSLGDDPHVLLKDKDYASKTMDPADPRLEGADYKFAKAAEGYDTYGIPGWIRQADVLRPLAPILSARDDTFTIRAYGDSRDKAGNIIAKAWCEATVRRGRDFVDTQDAADSVNPPTASHNKLFGRRYSVVSFRWLSPLEV